MPQEMTPAEAAALVRPVDSIGLPLGPGQPVSLIHALGERDDWEHLEVLCAMLVDFYELPNRPGVRTLSTFFGPAERIYRDAGADIEFIPVDFRRFERVFEARAPRVMTTMATPPDPDGWLSLSVHAGGTVAELARASADPDRLVVVEASSAFPRTVGLDPHPHRIHVSDVDVLIPTDRTPVVLADAPLTEVEEAIAHHVGDLVGDGATLQTGFGAIPSAVAGALARATGGGDYGIHSEMFTTGLMRLCQAGKVTNARKGIHEGRSVTTFAAGEAELYEWLDGRDDVAFAPVSVVNDPMVIAGNHRMVTINGAVTVDLHGQVVADTVVGRQYSGVGGHEDFVAGAGLQADDRSIICVPSLVTLGDGSTASRIVAGLGDGVVSTPRHHTDVVVTEHGVAELRGKTVAERAVALAGIAHPSVRDQLLEAAAALWPGRSSGPAS